MQPRESSSGHLGNPSKEEEANLRKEGGLWLKRRREELGLSQRDVADCLGLKFYSFISQVENGRTPIPPELLQDWSGACASPRPNSPRPRCGISRRSCTGHCLTTSSRRNPLTWVGTAADRARGDRYQRSRRGRKPCFAHRWRCGSVCRNPRSTMRRSQQDAVGG